ncbi:MAG: NAD(P)H-hydrate dehydratase [Leptospirillia bacterium]
MRVTTAAQMQALDRETIDTVGIPGAVLMEHAGTLTARAIRERYGDLTGRRVLVLCGKGNNGGDGFVIARHLSAAGASVMTFLAGHPADLKGDARVNMEAFAALGGSIHPESDIGSRLLINALTEAELIVDALFGTGLNQPLRPPASDWVQAVGNTSVPVVAVDIPSGIHADTGEAMGAAIHADLTVTYGLPKRGHFCGAGVDHSGHLVVADIGIPEQVVAAAGIPLSVSDPDDLRTTIPKRRTGAHKGSFGHMLVIAGSPGMTGAATLSARGAQCIGAGLVTVAVPERLNPILEEKLTEAMTLAMPETASGTFSSKALEPLLEAAAARSVTVIGPGLSRDAETRTLVRDFVARVEGPLVIDADALGAFEGHMEELPLRTMPTVLTPHPGEMGKLTGTSAAKVEGNRIEIARDFAREREVTLVLKGAHTVIADPYGSARINPSGGPALASGGTGDVLAGMIGGLLAQGLGAADAAALAVYLHGLAADLWVAEHGDVGLVAGNVAERVPEAFCKLATRQTPPPVATIAPLG